MLELRILSGLHRGATLPLDARPLLIGADDDADVVLVDPDIATRHASLTLSARGWSLAALDGDVLGADHNRPFTSLELQAGDLARLGHVWLTVADAESPWKNPPAEPVPDDAAHVADIVDPVVIDDEQDTGSHLDEPEQEPAKAPQPVAPEPVLAKPAAARTGRHAGWRRSKMAAVAVGLVTVLSACAAYKLNSRAEADTPPAAAARGPKELASLPPGVPAPAPAPKLSPPELREALRMRLKEVDLLKRFDLDLKDKAWTLHASLDADEAARFERILKSFIQAHNITFPVNAKVGSAETMLPFRIREVISGSNASVVTQDGNRLYVGDAYRGARLVAVEGRFLQFDGERKIKVKW